MCELWDPIPHRSIKAEDNIVVPEAQGLAEAIPTADNIAYATRTTNQAGSKERIATAENVAYSTHSTHSHTEQQPPITIQQNTSGNNEPDYDYI